MTFAPQKPYLRSLCCRNRRPATLSTPCPILPRKAPVEIPVQNGEKFAFSPICCRPPPSPPPLSSLPSLPPPRRRRPRRRAPFREQRCAKVFCLAGWLAVAGLASGAVQKDGQRPRVRLRSETDRDGERGSRLWPPAARSHMYTHACGLRNGHSASTAPTTDADGHTEWARNDYLGARPPRRNRPPKT